MLTAPSQTQFRPVAPIRVHDRAHVAHWRSSCRRVAILVATAALLASGCTGGGTAPPRGNGSLSTNPGGDEGGVPTIVRQAQRTAGQHVGTAAAEALRHAVLPRNHEALDDAARLLRHTYADQALVAALRVLEAPEDDDVAMRAHDIAGLAALSRRTTSVALEHLLEAEQLGTPSYAAYRDLWTARAALAEGRHELARDRAQRAQTPLYRTPYYHESRFLVSRARLGIEDERRDGIRELDTLIAQYREYPELDRLVLELARAEIADNDPQSATRRLDEYVWARPFHPHAATANALLDDLVDQGMQRSRRSIRDELARGREMRLERHWGVAEELLSAVLDRAIAGDVGDGLRNEIQFQRALNAYDAARFEDALEILDTIDETGPEGVSSFERARWRSRTLSRLGYGEEGYQVLAAFYQSRSATARHEALQEYAFDLGMYDRAIQHALARGGERSLQDIDGGFLYYLARDYDRAASVLDALTRRSSGVTRARAHYWLGRTYGRQGNFDEAIVAYRAAIDTRPGHYYALQAHNRIREIELGADVPVQAEPSTSPARHSVEDQPQHTTRRVPLERPGQIHWAGPEQPLRGGLVDVEVSTDRDVFAPYHPDVAPDGLLGAFVQTYGDLFPDAEVASALFAVGAGEEARLVMRDIAIEFRSLDILLGRGREVSVRRPIALEHRLWAHQIDNRPSNRADWWGVQSRESRFPVPSDSDELHAFVERHAQIRDARRDIREALYGALAEAGEYYFVRRGMYDFTGFTSEDRVGPARHNWLRAFPLAYGRLIEPHARAYDINPYMLLGLMIVESDMNPDSISRADAYGLLQVIPKTGELVALMEGDVDFGIHDLMTPSESIRYGMFYLNELILKFKGQEMLAHVAYNAGPHQVQRWLEWRGEGLDMDEFVETVPFDGARRYPQRVIQHMSVYRDLYEGDPWIYVGNQLDPSFLDNIYF